MRIAVTGATGFIGRYIVRQLAESGHELNCWYREKSRCSSLEPYSSSIRWIKGDLGDLSSVDQLIQDCQAMVHNAFWRPGQGFRGAEGEIVEFARVNMLGTLQLIESSYLAGLQRFVFVSTCAVHEKILPDRPLDEAHPLWPYSHYGAHKAALEKFVHSYGGGAGFPICALRPTGVYGIREPVSASKWYPLVRAVANNEVVRVRGGGKEVHAADVAKAIDILLTAEGITGEAYACYDRYISEYEVATLAKQFSGSCSQILGDDRTPANQIETGKIRALGMEFGSTHLLHETIRQLVDCAVAETD